MWSYGVLVHEAPDPSRHLAGKQDDEAGKELKEKHNDKTRRQRRPDGNVGGLLGRETYTAAVATD